MTNNFLQFLFLFTLHFKGILHVSYAPEYETVADLREKLKGRRRDVQYRLRLNKKTESSEKKRIPDDSDYEPNAKHRKI